MIPRILAALLGLCFFAGTASAQTCTSLPYTLTNGTTADASQVMANFNYVLNCANLERNAADGRLTLASTTPVTTSDQTAKTTLYYTPYKGNQLALYDGTSIWSIYSFSELSIAVPSTTNTMYDVFLYANAGTPILELLAWTNDTTRATALATQDGKLVKSGATTRRYVGSFRTTGTSGQTEDSMAKRYVWNYYNRVLRRMSVIESTDNWTYTSATWRQARASTANQLDYVVGVEEDIVYAEVRALWSNSGGGVDAFVGIGVDSTTAPGTFLSVVARGGAGQTSTSSALARQVLGLGRHTLVWLESGQAAGTTTWYGDAGAPPNYQSGIYGEIWG
jgi:hypothetical protein